MSLTFKLLSLVIRTAAKPIGNYIKRQAHEHEGFRRFAINQAQRVHRIDMRMRLGLLHDPEAQKRMHDKEQKAAEEKKQKAEAPTVRTEQEQKKYDEQKARDEREGGEKKKKKDDQPQKMKIRPLSDARAIELGANFFSETFIFLVAVGLLLTENFRSRKQASNRRDEVQERLEGLEIQVERLKREHNLPELEALNESIKRSKENQKSWWNPAGWWRRTQPDDLDEREKDSDGERKGQIPGNVPNASHDKSVKPAESPSASFREGENAATSSTTPPTRIDSTEAGKKTR